MKNGELKIANDRLTHTQKTKNAKGITLVALVITIIILLILATISIQSLTNTGLFARAKEARDKTQNATENQAKTLNEYEDELNKYISETPETPKLKKVADNIGTVLSTTDNTELQDAYGNKIVVPAGFKIVSTDDTSSAQTVDKGIVIEDGTVDSDGKATATNGSQFVWIPVGKIYTDTEKTEANIKRIALGRYDFDYNTGVASAYSGSYVEEDANDASTLKKYGNTIAKNITNFKNSATQNGGYYIGRYEARTTKARTAEGDELTQITEKGEDQVYNYVTQLQAASQAQNMYNSAKFTSDLMNSYAWDTAALFLQKCGTNATYSIKTSVNSSLSSTGTNTQSTKDIECNVYDMASNLVEWTTETQDDYDPYTRRGGFYCSSSYGWTCTRNISYYGNNKSTDYQGFRPILYVKVSI